VSVWLPHSEPLERELLGACLAFGEHGIPEAIDQSITAADDFFVVAHQRIYEAIRAVSAARGSLDVQIVADALREAGHFDAVGGHSYLSSLYSDVPTIVGIEKRAEIVRDYARRRRAIVALREAATLLAKGGHQDVDIEQLFADAEARIGRAITPPAGATGCVEHISAVVDRVKHEAIEHRGQPMGLATGLHELDNILAGLHSQELLYIGGRPGMGKTAFALDLSIRVAQGHGKGVLVCSLEMGRQSLVWRLICSRGQVSADRARTGRLRSDEMDAVIRTDLDQLPIWIDDRPDQSPGRIRSVARRIATREPCGLGLVVVDYLQLMDAAQRRREGNREQEVSALSRALKALSKELDVPVVALSQLNRSVEQRSNRRPSISDLRESGGMEQDADVIMLLYRDDYYDPQSLEVGVVEVNVAKQRNGRVGVVRLHYDRETQRFDNLSTLSAPTQQQEEFGE